MAEADIGRVFLKFGSDCNFNCRHCIQHPSCGVASSPVVSERVYKYLEHLAQVHLPKDDKINLTFWGGEPLLYWDAVKTVIARLGDSVEYSMTSNGALLTDDKVEYMNKHDIYYTLSNDGVQTAKVRGVNVLEDETIRQRFLSIHNRAVDAVIHAYNQDYQSLLAYMRVFAPMTYLCTEYLSCTWDMPSDIYAFDFDKYRASLRKLHEEAKTDIINGAYSLEVGLVRDYAHSIMSKVAKEHDNVPTPLIPRPVCAQVHRVSNIDCDGNVYVCHNIDKKIGTVEDSYSTLTERYDALYKLPDGCKDCECVYFCRGSCPYSHGQPGKSAMCEIARIRYEESVRFVASFADVTLPEPEVCHG